RQSAPQEDAQQSVPFWGAARYFGRGPGDGVDAPLFTARDHQAAHGRSMGDGFDRISERNGADVDVANLGQVGRGGGGHGR
ncbi:hypothetical protein RZS08_03780, partial [Arthrospira platensis SPKY1]|nr:hypothetical protein [Arthrospira platensis SPKY1]